MEMLGSAKGGLDLIYPCLLYSFLTYTPTHTLRFMCGVFASAISGAEIEAEQDGYTWPTIGLQFRSKHIKMLKMTPHDNSDTMAYLKT
jgi:hypothetical protein